MVVPLDESIAPVLSFSKGVPWGRLATRERKSWGCFRFLKSKGRNSLLYSKKHNPPFGFREAVLRVWSAVWH